MTTSNDRFLTLTDAAERIATPVETLRYWCHVGKLRAFRPGRRVLIRESDLLALVEASAVADLRLAKAKAQRPARAKRGAA